MAFTLQTGRWYGWQMIPGYVGERCVPFCCPCQMREVMPLKSGNGQLRVEVWLTGYAEGVQVMEKVLQVLHRSAHYLVARMDCDNQHTDRCVVISEIEAGWIEQFCPHVWRALAGPMRENDSGSIQQRLTALFSHRPG